MKNTIQEKYGDKDDFIMKKGVFIRKLSKFPSDAEIYPRHNHYLNKSWVLVKYSENGEEKSEAIIVD